MKYEINEIIKSWLAEIEKQRTNDDRRIHCGNQN